MKHVFLALLLVLAATACGKYEVYGRNLQYMSPPVFSNERKLVDRELQDARTDLAKAQAAGNPEAVKKAQARLLDVQEKNRAIDAEEMRRARGW